GEAVRDAAVAAPRAPAAGSLLIGREDVLGRVHAAWALARQGRRPVGWVTAEAGIGKTAVVEACVAQGGTEPSMWLAKGQCVEHDGTRTADDARARLRQEHTPTRLLFLGLYRPGACIGRA